MLTIFRDGFYKDLCKLFIVSILIGSLLISGVAYAADSYFSQTIDGLLGDYGEYDVSIQLRDQDKKLALSKVEEVTRESFPGAQIKKGPVFMGTAYYYIALPEKFKTKNVFGGIGNYYGKIPGVTNVGIMTEPRIVIQGIQGGVGDFLIPMLEQIDGVRFVYPDKYSLNIILANLNDINRIREEVKKTIDSYKILQVDLPIGFQEKNAVSKGEELASFLNDKHHVWIKNVTGGNDTANLVAMTKTLNEMKRFLVTYTAKVSIDNKTNFLKNGDLIVLSTQNEKSHRGRKINSNDTIVEVISTVGGKAEGIIIKGNQSELKGRQAFLVENEKLGQFIAQAQVSSNQAQLKHSIDESIKLLGQLEGLTIQAREASERAINVVDLFDKALSQAEEGPQFLDDAENFLKDTTDKISSVDTTHLQDWLDSADNTISIFLGGMQRLGIAQTLLSRLYDSIGKTQEQLLSHPGNLTPEQEEILKQKLSSYKEELAAQKADGLQRAAELDARINNLNPVTVGLTNFQGNIQKLKDMLGKVDDFTAENPDIQDSIHKMREQVASILTDMHKVNTDEWRRNLQGTKKYLDNLQGVDFQAIINELGNVKRSLPNLRDDEIGGSVHLINQYLAGQVIPNERILLLVKSNVQAGAFDSDIVKVLGHNSFTTQLVATGILTPDTRGEVIKLLQQVRVTIAALLSVIFVCFTLFMDHSLIMSLIKKSSVKTVISSVWQSRIYGFISGLILLALTARLTRANFPSLHSWEVWLLGGIIGLLVAWQSERLGPVRHDEVFAGQAIGLSYREILREIVIPAGKPGFLFFLNKYTIKFRGIRTEG